MTYTESKHNTPVDWNEFLNQKEIANGEWELASAFSADWVTCACGTQCGVIPRDRFGAPKDILLQDLGLEFYYAIKYRNILGSKETLQKIELRSSELINEINK
ncbi:MAG: hypothetical protein ACI9M3_000823 [Bacteroidia bacterium]|jgi:hypothetical protein